MACDSLIYLLRRRQSQWLAPRKLGWKFIVPFYFLLSALKGVVHDFRVSRVNDKVQQSMITAGASCNNAAQPLPPFSIEMPKDPT